MQSVYSPKICESLPIVLGAVGCSVIETTVAAVYAVPVREIRTTSRGNASVAQARQVAMYLAHVALGLNYSAVGRAFGRDRTTVAHACRLVEDRRDDPCTDDLLNTLEQGLGGLAQQVRT